MGNITLFAFDKGQGLTEHTADYDQLLSVLPVNEKEQYKGTVYIRTNEKIQALNRAYRDLASIYTNVQFIDLYDTFLDESGQLREEFTTDGLHLTIAGYARLSKALQPYL